MAVDPNIKKKADDIRNKIYGKEVRESLASGLEAMSSDVVENEGRQSVVEGRQDSVESQWQVVSDEMTDKDVISAPEIIAARNGESNLKTRLDKEHQEVTTQLNHIGYTSKEFNFSSSTFSTTGSIDKDSNILIVNNIGDFKIGQGIAIYNATKLRNTEDAWLCSEIININGNEITIKDYATHSTIGTLVEHDNYFSFKKMENHFKDLDYVNIEFEHGEYLLHSVFQRTVDGLFEANNIDATIFTISNKDYVNINFKGSTFMSKGEYKLQRDFTVLNQYNRTGVKAPTFIRVNDCNNVVIKNGTYNANSMTNILSKTGLPESWCYGFKIRGGHNILLENLTSLENESDGFYIGHQDTNPLYNVKLKNCTALLNGRQGLSVGGGAYVDIENCNFSYTGRDINGQLLTYATNPASGIDLELETGSNIPEELEKYSSIRNINIRNCILENNNYTLANGAYEGYLNIEDSYLGYNIPDSPATLFIRCRGKDSVTFKNCTLETVSFNHMSVNSKKILFDNCVFKGISYLGTPNEPEDFNIKNSDIYFSWDTATGVHWLANVKKDIHKISNSNIYYSKEYIVGGGLTGINGELSNCNIIYEDLDEGQTNKKTISGTSLMDNVKVYDNAQNSFELSNANNVSVTDMGDYSLVTNVHDYVKSINLDGYELTAPRHFTGGNSAVNVTITNATNHMFVSRVYANMNITINVTQYFGVRTVFLEGSQTGTTPIKITISDNSPYTFSENRKSVQFIPTSQRMRIDFILTTGDIINVMVTDIDYAELSDVQDV